MGCCSKKGGNDSAEKKVLSAMKSAGKQLKTAEITELTGIDKDTVSSVIRKLKSAGKISSPKRCYYEPKK